MKPTEITLDDVLKMADKLSKNTATPLFVFASPREKELMGKYYPKGYRYLVNNNKAKTAALEYVFEQESIS